MASLTKRDYKDPFLKTSEMRKIIASSFGLRSASSDIDDLNNIIRIARRYGIGSPKKLLRGPCAQWTTLDAFEMLIDVNIHTCGITYRVAGDQIKRIIQPNVENIYTKALSACEFDPLMLSISLNAAQKSLIMDAKKLFEHHSMFRTNATTPHFGFKHATFINLSQIAVFLEHQLDLMFPADPKDCAEINRPSAQNCPSNHWNDGTDYCADCGTDLQAAA